MVAMTSRFKLCTFDITNTLLKFQMSVGEQYTKVGRIYGIEREANKINTAFHHHWKIMSLNHPNFGVESGYTSRTWWKELVRRTFSVGSPNLSGIQLDSISNHLYEIYATNACWKVATGAEHLLKHLKQSNIVVGAISNFDERLDSVLKSTGLEPYFTFVLASYMVRQSKPSSEIFDLALKQIGVSRSDAIHVGDNVKLDYLAAKNAGWNALLIHNKTITEEILRDVKPNEIVKNIGEIRNHIFYLEKHSFDTVIH